MDAPKFIITYRHQDVLAEAQRVHAWLTNEFRADLHYLDVDSLSVGSGGGANDDCIDAEGQRVIGCRAVLPVIGPHWREASDAQGAWRLFQHDDMLYFQLAVAFKFKVRVIPILIEDAEIPDVRTLPGRVRRLTKVAAFRVRDGSFAADMLAIMAELHRL